MTQPTGATERHGVAVPLGVGAGLVRQERAGRFVNYGVDPGGMARLARWMGRYRAYWPGRMADLETVLKEMDQ